MTASYMIQAGPTKYKTEEYAKIRRKTSAKSEYFDYQVSL